MKWNCHIPGKEGTLWEGGFYPLTMEFTEEYPARPPKVGVCSGDGPAVVDCMGRFEVIRASKRMF